MLLSLHIENIAVIKSCDFDFSAGFMVLTGETGVGKSVVIDSINLLLGCKAERELIRHGEQTAMVSGLFGELSAYTVEKLGELGVYADDDGTILVQRSISLDGKNKITVNGRSISLSLLKSAMAFLYPPHPGEHHHRRGALRHGGGAFGGSPARLVPDPDPLPLRRLRRRRRSAFGRRRRMVPAAQADGAAQKPV